MNSIFTIKKAGKLSLGTGLPSTTSLILVWLSLNLQQFRLILELILFTVEDLVYSMADAQSSNPEGLVKSVIYSVFVYQAF